jgi:hypothetical protein
LGNLAAQQPDSFLGAGRTAEAALEDVRVSLDGVFVGTEKVADLSTLVVRVDRADLIDIKTPEPWARLRALAPGKEVTVAGGALQPGPRYFVMAEDTEATLLNLTDPTLSNTVTRALLELASSNPEAVVMARQGRRVV